MLPYRMLKRTRGHAMAMAAVACIVSVACDTFTDVDAPDIVQPDQLRNPDGAEALTNGAIAELYGRYPSHVYNTAVFSDEFFIAEQFRLQSANLDLRTQAVTFTEYGPVLMHLARTQAQMAIDVRQDVLPEPASTIGELFVVKGLVALFLGETNCNGTPLSEVVDLIPVYGGPISSDSMLRRALADFDSALVYAADSARILNLARIARGRTLTNLGRYAEAATTVAGVPSDYLYEAELTTAVPGQSNTVWQNQTNLFATVADVEGTNGVDYLSAGDPRVPTSMVGTGTDGQTDVYVFDRYSGLSSGIPMATGAEARLIEAEAALQANDPSWLTILTDLRAGSGLDFSGVAPLADQGSFDANVDLLFRERALWLFATGHRMADVRRLVRNYGRTLNDTWPVGPYKGGFTYGDEMVFILTLSEQSNPEGFVCTDKNP